MGPREVERQQLRERNLVLLAERLHWPEGALEIVRELEARNPGTSVYWGVGRLSDPKPGFYAFRGNPPFQRKFYGETALDLQATIAADSGQSLW